MSISHHALREHICTAETAVEDAARARTSYRDCFAETIRLIGVTAGYIEDLYRSYVLTLVATGVIDIEEALETWDLAQQLRADAARGERAFRKEFGFGSDAIPRDPPWRG